MMRSITITSRKATLLIAISLFALVSKATNYYSDPSPLGNMNNSGTAASPWASLSGIFSANKTFLAGDTLFLRNGNHGYAIIKGMHTDFVVIAPAPGHDPIISRIRISNAASTSASYWKLYGLTIQSEATGVNAIPSYNLVEIYPYATHITISYCTITSNLNTTGWTRADWRNRCNNGLSTRGKLNAHYLIEHNLIKNTAFALSISSSSTIVRENTVQYFTNDGSRVVGSDILFEKNKILDLVKVMTTSENHDDLFQSFTYATGGTGQDTLKNNIIRQNIFINTTDTARAFRGNAQGIGCFDGVYLNWRVENNIVITDHWHGISLYGAVNCYVTNNTVIDPYLISPVNPFDNNATDIGPTWIRIAKKTNGPASSGNVVKNNLLANNVFFGSPDMGTGSNNIVLGNLSNFSSFFVDVSNWAMPGNFDLHLLPGCAAIDAGDSLNAPLVDFDGAIRPQGAGFEVGAYEYSATLPTNATNKSVLKSNIVLYPNPANGILYLKVENWKWRNNGDLDIDIFNTAGEKVYSTRINMQAVQEITLPANLSRGIYFVRISDGWNFCTGKIAIN